MKIVNSLIKSIGLLLLVIFVLQVGGLTCANDVYAAGPSVVQGESIVKAVDLDGGVDTSSPTDLRYECQCPCHLSFSIIESATLSSCHRTESPLIHITRFSISSLSKDILQPPKVQL